VKEAPIDRFDYIMMAAATAIIIFLIFIS